MSRCTRADAGPPRAPLTLAWRSRRRRTACALAECAGIHWLRAGLACGSHVAGAAVDPAGVLEATPRLRPVEPCRSPLSVPSLLPCKAAAAAASAPRPSARLCTLSGGRERDVPCTCIGREAGWSRSRRCARAPAAWCLEAARVGLVDDGATLADAGGPPCAPAWTPVQSSDRSWRAAGAAALTGVGRRTKRCSGCRPRPKQLSHKLTRAHERHANSAPWIGCMPQPSHLVPSCTIGAPAATARLGGRHRNGPHGARQTAHVTSCSADPAAVSVTGADGTERQRLLAMQRLPFRLRAARRTAAHLRLLRSTAAPAACAAGARPTRACSGRARSARTPSCTRPEKMRCSGASPRSRLRTCRPVLRRGAARCRLRAGCHERGADGRSRWRCAGRRCQAPRPARDLHASTGGG